MAAPCCGWRRRRRLVGVPRRAEGDGGQAVPLVIAVVVVAAMGVVALGRVAAGAVDAARARTAADAAALAGASEGQNAAVAAAAANGGEVIAFVTAGDDVLVDVRVGRATARARATIVLARGRLGRPNDPTRPGGSASAG